MNLRIVHMTKGSSKGHKHFLGTILSPEAKCLLGTHSTLISTQEGNNLLSFLLYCVKSYCS